MMIFNLNPIWTGGESAVVAAEISTSREKGEREGKKNKIKRIRKKKIRNKNKQTNLNLQLGI